MGRRRPHRAGAAATHRRDGKLVTVPGSPAVLNGVAIAPDGSVSPGRSGSTATSRARHRRRLTQLAGPPRAGSMARSAPAMASSRSAVAAPARQAPGAATSPRARNGRPATVFAGVRFDARASTPAPMRGSMTGVRRGPRRQRTRRGRRRWHRCRLDRTRRVVTRCRPIAPGLGAGSSSVPTKRLRGALPPAISECAVKLCGVNACCRCAWAAGDVCH